MSSVRYGTWLGDLKNKQPTHTVFERVVLRVRGAAWPARNHRGPFGAYASPGQLEKRRRPGFPIEPKIGTLRCFLGTRKGLHFRARTVEHDQRERFSCLRRYQSIKEGVPGTPGSHSANPKERFVTTCHPGKPERLPQGGPRSHEIDARLCCRASPRHNPSWWATTGVERNS